MSVIFSSIMVPTSICMILVFRMVLLKKVGGWCTWAISVYAFTLFCSMILVLAQGGVVSDAYERLDHFRTWEKNNTLEDARINPEKYTTDTMLRMDLEHFKDSKEMEYYIEKKYVHCWGIYSFMVILSDIIFICICLLGHIIGRVRRLIFPKIPGNF